MFGQIKKGKLGTLVKSPFTKFTDAKGKDGTLTTHPAHQYHIDAANRAQDFIQNYKEPGGRIDSKLQEEKKRNSEEHKHILVDMVEAILFCGRQGLALQGKNDDQTVADPVKNRGNFLALLDLIAKYDNELKNHLAYGTRNQKCTSKTTQNELINIVGEYLGQNYWSHYRHLHTTVSWLMR